MSDILKTGMEQKDLVQLLYNSLGEQYYPISSFSDIGGATLGAVGSSTPTGLDFNETTDEAADINIMFPKNIDVTKAISVYVRWSSAGTAATDVVWDIDYIARALGEDVGVAVSNVSVTDTDSTTADALMESPVITIPADTLAGNTESLFLSLRRDADTTGGDTLASDATVFGIRVGWEITPLVVV